MQRLINLNSIPCFLHVWVFLAVVFFSVDSWGACVSVFYDIQNSNCSGPMGGVNCNEGVSANLTCSSLNAGSLSCPSTVQVSGGYYSRLSGKCVNGFNGYCRYTFRCTSQCEADSLNCVAIGHQWDSSKCICIDMSVCNSDKLQCEEVGGDFSWCY